MKFPLRGVALVLLAAAMLPVASAQEEVSAALSSERDKASYMVGMDVARSIAPAAPDMAIDAFERGLRNAFAGGEPLVTEAEVRPLAEGLMQRIAARSGRAPAGTKPPEVDRDKIGYMVGSDVGRSLKPIKDEIDLPVFMRALHTVLEDGKPLLTDEEANALRTAFSQRVQEKMQAQTAAAASRNGAEGAAFLAGNKTVKGVFTTPSGLQYMVLRQGAGPRPKPYDTVRVNYHGTLLDGSVFDSSYDRGEAAEFALGKVIPGWTEGVGLMPVGGKYRFWIPGNLAYGEKGAADGKIGPNATLVFDVELMGIVN